VAWVTPWPRHQVVWAPGPPSDIALPPALDLPYVKYHTYINDCALYRDEYAERTTCLVCGQGRYNIGNKKVPQKVVWYFPITPRQQWYFVDLRKQSSSHRNKSEDDTHTGKILTYPSDPSQWNALDIDFHEFEADPKVWYEHRWTQSVWQPE
jgi:hypothetical protein